MSRDEMLITPLPLLRRRPELLKPWEDFRTRNHRHRIICTRHGDYLLAYYVPDRRQNA